MKVRKAIKSIAALGIGATMMGATLMGAMAADLKDYPSMFIEDGQFDGYLVVGKEALAIDTIGMTNVALGLQKAAVTKTLVCGAGSTATTTVTGEQVQIEKTGDELNIGDTLATIQDTALDDGDLPSILADGTYDENEGETKNDVTYTQEISLAAGTGTVVFTQEDDEAPEAGVYLLFDKGEDMYTYTLEFESDVEYDTTADTDGEEDLESTTIELQGQAYTITEVDVNSDIVVKITMLVGENMIWMQEGETVTTEVDGVDHTIKMIDVANDAESCGFEVDGSSVWLDLDDTDTISGVTLGVTEIRAINNDLSDADICQVFIGANELVLEDGQEVEIDGDEVEGSEVQIQSTAGKWAGLTITFDPEDDIYMTENDEFVDPVFGNFKYIMGKEIANFEEIQVEASGRDVTLTFMNYDDDEIVIPWSMADGGAVILGEEPDAKSTGDPADGFYLQGEHCDGGADITNCEGAQFLVITTGDVGYVVEIANIDIDDNEIDFDIITTGGSDDGNDYDNGSNVISLGGSVGAITLDINETNKSISFINTDKGDLLTSFEGNLSILSSGFNLTENPDEGVQGQIDVAFVVDGSETDEVNIANPTGASGPVDFSDSNDDDQVYYTTWGSRIVYDNDDAVDLMIWHPEEQLYVEAFIAETGATTTVSDDAPEGCTVSEKPNPISASANKFDTEITSVTSQNLIAVGGPCANSVTSTLLGNPEVCWEGFEAGKAMIKLVENGNYVALIVAGGEGKDTRLAANILYEYEKYDLSGMEMVATTVSESGLSVMPK
jgi:hypothetical protein